MEQYRKSPRAGFLDYDGGLYFVTICTRERMHYFGEIADNKMYLSAIGKYADEQITSAMQLCGYVQVLLHVVMPNHIHAIVCIRKDTELSGCGNQREKRTPNPSLRVDCGCDRHVPILSRYINSLKGAVTKYARKNGIEFEWQPRYHDHYIRDNHDGKNISDYIINNVANWDSDCLRIPSAH